MIYIVPFAICYRGAYRHMGMSLITQVRDVKILTEQVSFQFTIKGIFNQDYR